MNKKDFVIIGGANGSGKTTFAQAFSDKYDYDFINADIIVEELGGDGIHQPETLKLKAGRKFFERVNELVKNNKSIMVESTLSGQYLVRLMHRMRKHGYKIELVYLFLENPAMCIERIKERVLKGGHHVPDDVVTRRYHKSKQNFWNTYKDLSDRWFLVYNSKQEFTEIALGMKHDYVVNNLPLFDKFCDGSSIGV